MISILMILFGLLGYRFDDNFLILSTSFTGSFFIARGISFVAEHYHNSFTINKEIEYSVFSTIDPYFYLYLGGICISTLLGSFI
jgi:hypothetical protein